MKSVEECRTCRKKSIGKNEVKNLQKFVIFAALCSELPVLPVFSLKCLKGHGCAFCGHRPSGGYVSLASGSMSGSVKGKHALKVRFKFIAITET